LTLRCVNRERSVSGEKRAARNVNLGCGGDADIRRAGKTQKAAPSAAIPTPVHRPGVNPSSSFLATTSGRPTFSLFVRPDGLQDAEHRPHRPRRHDVHRLLRRAELHGGAFIVHHRTMYTNCEEQRLGRMQLPKLHTRVRFPSPAPSGMLANGVSDCSSANRTRAQRPSVVSCWLPAIEALAL
jgi:hypothetical protein